MWVRMYSRQFLFSILISESPNSALVWSNRRCLIAQWYLPFILQGRTHSFFTICGSHCVFFLFIRQAYFDQTNRLAIDSFSIFFFLDLERYPINLWLFGWVRPYRFLDSHRFGWSAGNAIICRNLKKKVKPQIHLKSHSRLTCNSEGNRFHRGIASNFVKWRRKRGRLAWRHFQPPNCVMFNPTDNSRYISSCRNNTPYTQLN